MSAEEDFFPILDEQVAVGFTGRVNILDPQNSALLGVLTLNEGQIHNARFEGAEGLKAFYNACVASFDPDRSFRYVVEPELVQEAKKIHYPYSVLKRKAAEVVALYKESKTQAPPANVKLLVNPVFIEMGAEVSGEEFDLLATIADYNKVKDIYKHSNLLDYQITNGLVSLRKKKALTVVKRG